MKKNDWVILISVSTYTYLFYQQHAGLNVLIFTILILILCMLKYPGALKNASWITAAAGSLISTFFVMWYGNKLALAANIVSLSAVSAYSVKPEASFLVAQFNSAWSVLSSMLCVLIDNIAKQLRSIDHGQTDDSGGERTNRGQNPMVSKLFVFVFPLVITGAFFLMYQSANPLYYTFTKNLGFEIITWELTGIILSGALLMYGFFRQRQVAIINAADSLASDKLYASPEPGGGIRGFLSLENEIRSGRTLLILLNLLLLSVNIIDGRFLWGSDGLPGGMTYSSYVHQGTGTIIFSVISAIAIILFFFRGQLNFTAESTTTRILAYAWIIQNIVMLCSTGFRNYLYIEEYGLTYKRIGVDFYLLLTFIGLVTTFIKIYAKKSNWFLFRKNSWAFYIVLIFSATINWDGIITGFNLYHSRVQDIEYLVSLGPSNLPELIASDAYSRLPRPEENTDQQDIFSAEHILIEQKRRSFLQEWESYEWPSWSYSKQQVYEKIMKQLPEGAR